MAGDEGTLATSAQVILAIGQNASAEQILEANTNYWILYAEAEMSMIAGLDLVADIASIGANFLQFLASVASARAAMHGINQNQNSWQLATSQSKLNVLNSIWEDGKEFLENVDKLELMGVQR
ncbi:hypothetical protein LCGC14_2926320 [marine sediment metagenome]|uniref:Uncharacterized protein n=1 Tax=marine sediment metagenome TaxID=412755 RepID=A0A0F8XMJ7_9ZZZZ